jgi:hypothetical protein
MKILVFLTCIILLFGCHRAECPGYSEEYLNWIPYKLSEGASFTDGNDTLNLLVYETYKSGAYKQHSVWNMEIPCEINALAYISGDSNSHQIRIDSESIPNEPDIFYNYAISVNKNDWSAFSFYVKSNDIAAGPARTPVPLLLSYCNGYKEYSNVLKLAMDTVNWLNPKMIYQIYIAESVGIIQFTETKNHKIWSLIGK